MAVSLLFDNGSLRAASTLNLRRIAAGLSRRVGDEIRPVSLLHSSAVSPESLDGVAAELVEPALDRLLRAGRRDFLLLPLFFGPSGAFTDYLPRRLRHLRQKHGDFRAVIAPPLVDPGDPHDTRIAAILADGVRAVRRDLHLPRVPVIVVDHGSPQREVTAVRDRIARQLKEHLDSEAGPLAAASMERRPEPEYAFNEPLLRTQLAREGFDRGDVIVALLFLSPGRHAGPGGDIAAICREAEAAQPGLRVHLTRLVGDDPRLLDVLADRYHTALNSLQRAE